MSGEPYAEVVAELKKKAQASDSVVRVIVEVRCDTGSAAVASDTSPDKAKVARAVEKLSRVMRSAGVAVVEPIAGTPYVVMELSDTQLDTLVSTGMVKALQEDVPELGF